MSLTETWTLKKVYAWPLAVYVLVVAVMLLACAMYSAIRLKRTDDIMRQVHSPAQPDPREPS